VDGKRMVSVDERERKEEPDAKFYGTAARVL
jgi:hypothetical protein